MRISRSAEGGTIEQAGGTGHIRYDGDDGLLTKINLKHPGTWKLLGGTEVSFEFDDDTPGWKRLWKVKIDGPISNGNVTIGGVPHGSFKLLYTK